MSIRFREWAYHVRDSDRNLAAIVVYVAALVVTGGLWAAFFVTRSGLFALALDLAPVLWLWPVALLAAWFRFGVVDRAVGVMDGPSVSIATVAALLVSAGLVALSLLVTVVDHVSDRSVLEVARLGLVAVSWGASALLASFLVALMPCSWRLCRSATATVAVGVSAAMPVVLVVLAWKLLGLVGLT